MRASSSEARLPSPVLLLMLSLLLLREGLTMVDEGRW